MGISVNFQTEDEMNRLRHDNKTNGLKARAVAQARIKELEEKMSMDNEERKEEVGFENVRKKRLLIKIFQ